MLATVDPRRLDTTRGVLRDLLDDLLDDPAASLHDHGTALTRLQATGDEPR